MTVTLPLTALIVASVSACACGWLFCALVIKYLTGRRALIAQIRALPGQIRAAADDQPRPAPDPHQAPPGRAGYLPAWQHAESIYQGEPATTPLSLWSPHAAAMDKTQREIRAILAAHEHPPA